MKLQQNYFQIFDLPIRYEIDAGLLAQRYRALQREFHPDKFATRSSREQMLSMQYTTQINEANTTLCDPVLRATYLLKLAGVEVNPEQTTGDSDFLMQQLILRERLEEVRTAADSQTSLDRLSREARALFIEQQQEFGSTLAANALDKAQNTLHKLQFLAKLQRQIEQLEEDLLD